MRNTLKDWVDGHVTITVRGKRFERLINLAIRDGLHIWNIRRQGTEIGQLDILIRDYFRLRPLLRQTGCRSHVVRREGMPFWLVRLRLRAGLAIGFLLFFIGVYMLSSFVWSVEVMGTHKMSTLQVRQVAETIGIKPGVWKVKLKEPIQLQRDMLQQLPDAAWVGVEIKGTKAIIQIVEKEKQEVEKAPGPRNLIAKKKAVVHSILAEAGKTLVSVNQFVSKGQVLISGIIGNETRQGIVAARGKVEGEVWYISNISIPLHQQRNVYTGLAEDNHFLLVGDYSFRIWPFQVQPYKQFETHEEKFQLSYKQFHLPVGWKVEKRQEMEVQKFQISSEQAIETGKSFARQDVLKRAGNDAVIKQEKVLHVKEENGKVYLSIHYSVIEDITEEQPITHLPPAPDQGANQSN
ncbi:sporulation protein YqfD [Brevibacillus sp. SYSU BS000544]|uniref:sporulation protein YqfD n=1 Tax=Brevibacillus sp. SYSU BS000544 TaxID=3416443 RepID=UPI003CE450CD